MASRHVEEKRQRISEDILARAIPVIEDGSYSQLTIRELCERLGITTGLFYRHFKTKSDLMCFYAIRQASVLYEEAKDELRGLDIRKRLVRIVVISMQANLFMGPDCLLAYLNNENPLCDCSVGRGIFEEQIHLAFEEDPQFQGCSREEIQVIADYLAIISKGLCYEWYTQRDRDGFDIMKQTDKITRMAVEQLTLPEGQAQA
ncbi:MAG: TetR/AcrR family transcriptional regulator [Clostridia bacterium]|nr:TetR/AcrR family transcriptional regulator [Clostridia bacterium]